MKYYTEEQQRISRIKVRTWLASFVVCATALSYTIVNGGELASGSAILGATFALVARKLFEAIHGDYLRRKYG